MNQTYPHDVPLCRSVLAKVSGDDEIHARDLHQTYKGDRPSTCTIILSANYDREPRIDGADEAMFERLRVLPFPERPESQRDPSIRQAVRQDDGAKTAMLSALIEHAAFMPDPPADTPTVRDERRAFQRDVMGPDLYDFINDHLEYTGDDADRLSTKQVFERAVQVSREQRVAARVWEKAGQYHAGYQQQH